MPLLAIPLDVVVPSTPEVDELDEHFRRSRLESAVSTLLGRLLDGHKVLLAFEDVHWMDEASAALLSVLAIDVENGPWITCVTRRDEETGFVAPQNDACTTLRPRPLLEADAEKLLLTASEDAPLRPDEVDVLVERSGGNPLFLQELLSAARAAGGVDELPNSVEAIVTTQIDRLPRADLRLLRYAAVLGVSFTDDLIGTLLEGEEGTLDTGAWLRLEEFIEPEGPGLHRFRHALMRDAAYEGLSFRRRRELHARVGEEICRRAGADDEDFAELLSMHFFYAQRYEEAWSFSRVAGERARTKYSNVEAVMFLGRAIDAGKKAGVPDVDLAAIYERRGDVYWVLGNYAEAAAAFSGALRLLGDDPVASAGLLYKRSWIPARAGRLASAIRWVRKGQRGIEGVGGADADAIGAQLTAMEAALRGTQGRYAEAIALSESLVALESTAGDDPRILKAIARGYATLDVCYFGLGQMDRVNNIGRGIEIYERVGELSILGDLHLQRRGLRLLSRRVGSRRGTLWTGSRCASARGRCGGGGDRHRCPRRKLLLEQGRLTEAEELLKEALRVNRGAGQPMSTATALANLGRVASVRGDAEATALLAEAIPIFVEVGERMMSDEVEARLAEAMLLAGDREGALAAAERLLARQGATEGTAPQEPLLLRVRGCALLWQGKSEEGVESLREALVSAEKRGAEFERVLVLNALACWSDATGMDWISQDERVEVAETVRRLGVVSLPPVPLEAS